MPPSLGERRIRLGRCTLRALAERPTSRSIKSSCSLIYLITLTIMIHMAKDWQVLSRLGRGGAGVVMGAPVVGQDGGVEGPFQLPPPPRLSSGGQTFLPPLVPRHGSTKQMVQFF